MQSEIKIAQWEKNGEQLFTFSPKTAKTPLIATLTRERPLEPAAMPRSFRFGANQNGRKETKELRRQNSMNTKKTAVKHKRKRRERERERERESQTQETAQCKKEGL
jgi:hypothetical protein